MATEKNVLSNNIFLKIKDNIDIFVISSVIVVILMIIIPLPAFILDLFLLMNLALSLFIIISTMYVSKPAEFSTFPSLILLTTIFGLGLNVSSTRLILQQGPAFEGKIIRAFGNFVVGGNYFIGIIIFIIILAIQFLVITKGATRVSEVAARFALDALPGKQMSIDSDLNAGIITEEEARKKREELRLETDFYGNMDGSTKFVSGNVKVSFVITFVDIVAGLIIGLMRGEDISTAARTYTLLTIGDGLVSQIPALLVSTATGIIVTRTSSREKFGEQVAKQILPSYQVMLLSGITIFILGFIPGFPTLLNFLLGGVIVFSAYLTVRKEKTREIKSKEEASKAKPKDVEITIEDIVKLDPMSIELGYNLIALVDKSQNGDLLDRIKNIRKRIGSELGILVPPIRILDNTTIDASEYIIKIRGAEVSRGKVFINRLMIMNPNLDLSEIDGIEVREPTFGLPAKWISMEDRGKAEMLGFDLYDASSVISTHLTEVIKKYAHELLTRQDVKTMLDVLQKNYPVVVEEALKYSSVGEIQKILQNLLREGVRIRDMLTILEVITDSSKITKNPDTITEYVRQALGKQIVQNYVSENNTLKAIVIDPELEEIIEQSLHETAQGTVSTLENEYVDLIVNQVTKNVEKALKKGFQPVIVTSHKIRRLIRELTERTHPTIGILSFPEIPINCNLEQVGLITFEENSQ